MTAHARSADAGTTTLSDRECRALLAQTTVGRIGFVADGLPVILPVNYRVGDIGGGLWIVLRVRADHAIDNAPDFVAFEIDGIDADRREGWSVLVRGALHHLDEQQIEQLALVADPAPWPQDERTSWIAVKSRTISGRRITGPGLEWAFSTDAYL
ncbi:MAG: hypothetical protein JWL73_560 [Actinomycetia bacterium]|nr:hypothetical protein [Actinomycetes bacterium]